MREDSQRKSPEEESRLGHGVGGRERERKKGERGEGRGQGWRAKNSVAGTQFSQYPSG